MAVSSDELRDAMRYWATGVVLVTASYNGINHGMTVSSFTSISLDPPLVLISLERSTRTRDLVLGSGKFAVTVLARSQQAISDRFAGRHTEYEDRFAGLPVEIMSSGIQVVSGALMYLDCRLEYVYEASTHSLVIGEVTAVKDGAASSDENEPLIYFNRAYRHLQN